jgi:hypothetical protein
MSRSTASATATSCRRCARRISCGSSRATTAREIAERQGLQDLERHAHRLRPQPRRDHGLPGAEAVGKLEPGVYVMTAKPHVANAAVNGGRAGRRARATQWFVVSDLGLTAFKGGTAFMCSCARSPAPSRSPMWRSARRPQQRGAGDQEARTATGPPPSIRASPAARAGWRPGSSWRRNSGRLRLPRSRRRRLRSHRPRREGPRGARAVDAFVFRSAASTAPARRGAHRAPARRRGRRGAGVPLTLVVERPDGVEYRRAQVEDQGLGGRAFSSRSCRRQRGTWRVAAYTDPKGSPSAKPASWSRITSPSGSRST